MKTKRFSAWCCLSFLLVTFAARTEAVDLLQRYPTKLTAGDVAGERARPWEFTAADVFRVAQFRLEVCKALRLTVGPADLGIGHCADGAVWAVLIPQEGGELTSSAASQPEAVAHVWLRFHPKEIARLFPPDTVSADGATNLVWQMRAIANAKMNSSWQAGGRAMIPEPKDMTVDVDTKGGPRRFFVVNTQAASAEYVAAFANRPSPVGSVTWRTRTAPPAARPSSGAPASRCMRRASRQKGRALPAAAQSPAAGTAGARAQGSVEAGTTGQRLRACSRAAGEARTRVEGRRERKDRVALALSYSLLLPSRVFLSRTPAAK